MRAGAAGLGFAAVSAATFGTSGTFASSLMSAGWTPAGAVLTRISLAALFLTVPAVLQLRGRWALLRASLRAIASYGLVAVAACQVFFFNAVDHLSVGVALLLEYSGTLLVVVWMWLRHHHRPNQLTLIGGALALLGLTGVLDLFGAQHVDVVGVLWGLGAAVGLAMFFVLSAHSDDLVPPTVMAWAGLGIGALALGVAALAGIVPFHVATRDVDFAGWHTSWIVPALGLSLVAAAIAYVTGIGAARRLGARLASFVGLSEVLFAILFAWLLLAQQPGWWQLGGGVVVLIGIALVRLGDQDLDAAPEVALPAHDALELPLPT